MRAIILVGGQGTRLRPLTNRIPKALVPVAGRPLLEHLLQQLADHQIRHVSIATTPHSRAIEERFGRGRPLGLDLTYTYETKPLGSGGAVALTAADWTEPFLVINGDIISDIDIGALVQLHAARTAVVTVALHNVTDPSRYGVVALGEADRITRFVEKPPRQDAPSTWINAGFWLFEPTAVHQIGAQGFNRVEDDLFPRLAGHGGAIYGFRHDGYWIDVGTPETYHRANMDALRASTSPHLTMPGVERTGRLRVDPSSIVQPGAALHGPVVIGSNCVVHEGAVVRDSILWDDVTIEADAVVEHSILSTGARVASGCRLRDGVIAPGSSIARGEKPEVTF
jgi:NDP-sugar pyrophosphorylase family protein